MKICKYCGRPYKKNTNIPEHFPEFMKKAMEYLPDCDCLEKQKQKELERLEVERQKQCLINKVKKYKDISVMDSKFLESNFNMADMMDPHMNFAKKYAKKFTENGGAPAGVMFYGPVGTGKTFASACIANELMNNGFTVLVMNLGLYINKIQREWAEAEKDVLNYATSCDLLVIDDFGAEDMTPWKIDKTYALIDARYRAKKPMIISTNLSEELIAKNFKDRIADRIKEMCFPMLVEGKSKRTMNVAALTEWLSN